MYGRLVILRDAGSLTTAARMGAVKSMLRQLLRRPADALVYSSKALDKIIDARVAQILDSRAGTSTDSRVKAEVINNPPRGQVLSSRSGPDFLPAAEREPRCSTAARRSAGSPPELRVHGTEERYRSWGRSMSPP